VKTETAHPCRKPIYVTAASYYEFILLTASSKNNIGFSEQELASSADFAAVGRYVVSFEEAQPW
jgi:hypothetical protein